MIIRHENPEEGIYIIYKSITNIFLLVLRFYLPSFFFNEVMILTVVSEEAVYEDDKQPTYVYVTFRSYSRDLKIWKY
jgi:hypothetical protein